ncbi:MAG TPA: hypothetical protein VIW03_02100 [Anaeromyxobacter sp.]
MSASTTRRGRGALRLAGALALLACSRAPEPPPPPAASPAPPGAATASAPLSGLDAGKASALGLPSGTTTRAYAGGRPIAWWSERLAKLKREGPEDLYRLTLERARLNGLAVVEKDGGEIAVAAAPVREGRP